MPSKLIKLLILLMASGLLIIVFLDKPWLQYHFPENKIVIQKNGHVLSINQHSKPSLLSSIGRILRTTYNIKEETPGLQSNLKSDSPMMMVQFKNNSLLRVDHTNIHISKIIIPLNPKEPSFIEIGTNGHLVSCYVRRWEIWFLRETYQSYLVNNN